MEADQIGRKRWNAVDALPIVQFIKHFIQKKAYFSEGEERGNILFPNGWNESIKVLNVLIKVCF